MSWRDAPLYVRACDLARWLLLRLDDARTHRDLATGTSGVMVDLVGLLALALTFPATRDRHREEADHAIARLRSRLALACELGVLAPRQLRYATVELDAVGRMLGGWRKAGRFRNRLIQRGSEVQAAPPASFAAVRTGTTPTGAARRIGTGTTRRTGTGTSVSESPCPPPP